MAVSYQQQSVARTKFDDRVSEEILNERIDSPEHVTRCDATDLKHPIECINIVDDNRIVVVKEIDKIAPMVNSEQQEYITKTNVK